MTQHKSVAPGEAPFYIPATGRASRPRRNLKHNDTFAVFDSHGDIGASAGGPEACSTATRAISRTSSCDQRRAAAAAALGDQRRQPQLPRRPHQPRRLRRRRIVLLKDTVHIARTIYLCDGSLRERIALINHGAEPVSLRCRWLSPAISPTSSRCAASAAPGAGRPGATCCRRQRASCPTADWTGRCARRR